MSAGLRGSRVWVVGPPGSGKTTLASRIARWLGLPRYELDEFFWRPGWQRAADAEFRSQIEGIARSDAWVIDGQYFTANEALTARATTVIWLDLPLVLVLSRTLRRSVRRLLSQERFCNGNVETLQSLLGSGGIIRYAVASYGQTRRANSELLHHLSPEQAGIRIRSAPALHRLESQIG